ncbi:hypothetical protein [Candidatus Marinarcus aquaticus]|uniref:Uncharacterized protein n=1 Tax=Candidatus Marinarcus aquaticus TaxID=2044504 RepID=A0A4Q0XRQ0_9BACT|nr:hypothetical protein [Candidatus Marinarcus aquaticus]RXJ60187.1 hypothetical protein CRV04_04075 [Candidatus Marinarcus aquaticus]
MQVNSNISSLTAMKNEELRLNESAQVIAEVANSVGDPQNQEVTQDLVDAIVEQIPTVIAYEANAKAIDTINAVTARLLDIKA